MATQAPTRFYQVRNSPIKEENVVNYDAIIAVDNPELKLKPGMNAVVYITTGERKNVLRVPNSALRFQPPSDGGDQARPGPGGGPPSAGPPSARGGPPPAARKGPAGPADEKTVYFNPENPTYPLVPVKVKLGLNDGIQSEVLDGLNEGDTLIILIKPSADGGSTGMNNPFGGPMGGGRRGR